MLAVALTVVSCGGPRPPAPADPEAAVRAFLGAVRANSLVAMGEIWGGSRGPASAYMDPAELEQRLTVMRIYLEHEQYEILPPGESGITGDRSRERIVRVQLTRKGCTPVVPFTVVKWRDGWLVSNFDIAAAGNPARSCEPGETRRSS
ncbi:MAG: hypothetical protein GTN62_02135 [Gemmatimonadales bacterium]|nr:hypothetical protein [Gemmatimonadales bacterium]NIN12363.1 hypothetical protein [Gemmatimonadales bacterium]NIN48901.1 hypothetical protein [Gemmatimonadales bacterium]NIP06365.1 hypothetical protein [Gemmatimonadales bacterium]NIR00738.1 hypothetical protein [Gemmatimonadales bacterium]